MSDFFENPRSPGLIGFALGGVILLGFGGLSMAVFDDRLNGNNASEIKDEIRDHDFNLLAVENEIKEAKRISARHQRNKEVYLKIENNKNKTARLENQKEELKAEIESKTASINQLSEEQLAYRDQYRTHERKRAIGEEYEEIALTTGKLLKNVKIREVLPDKIRFTTETGGSSVEWKELHEDWITRFQIGEGELEEHRQKLKMARLQRGQVREVTQKNRSLELREMELNKSRNRIASTLKNRRAQISQANGKINSLLERENEYLSKESAARAKGHPSSHGNTARKARHTADKLATASRLASRQIVELEKELKSVEQQIKLLKEK